MVKNQMPIADECMKLLDEVNVIVMFRNGAGTYTALAGQIYSKDGIENMVHDELASGREVDGPTPSEVLHRLAEKRLTGNIFDRHGGD